MNCFDLVFRQDESLFPPHEDVRFLASSSQVQIWSAHLLFESVSREWWETSPVSHVIFFRRSIVCRQESWTRFRDNFTSAKEKKRRVNQRPTWLIVRNSWTYSKNVTRLSSSGVRSLISRVPARVPFSMSTLSRVESMESAPCDTNSID